MAESAVSITVGGLSVVSTSLNPLWQTAIGSVMVSLEASWKLSDDSKTFVVDIAAIGVVVPGFIATAVAGNLAPAAVQLSARVTVPRSDDLVKDAKAIMAKIITASASGLKSKLRSYLSNLLANPGYSGLPSWLTSLLQTAISQL